jgi:diguanylate cyclase (GGDEF)-like protein
VFFGRVVVRWAHKEDKRLLKMAILRTKQLQEEIHELHKLVYEDSLTKSYNRKWLEDNIIDSNKLNVRDSGTLVVVDLNKFKEINDTYGHIIGDKVLFTIAKQLRETKGRVVRYGGDEFIIIFDKGLSTSDITKELESVLKYLQKVSFQIKDRKPFKVDFAYGMAPFDNNSKIDQVIEATDKAMYLNKKHKHFFQNEKR